MSEAEEFKLALEFEGYTYREAEGRILVMGGNKYKRNIWLTNWVSLPSGVVFINEGNVWLDSLRRIPPGVVFYNSGRLQLTELSGNKPFHLWDGNIEGIDSKRLLNKMISIGLFDR